MNTHFILNNGISIPSIGYGTWQVEKGPSAVESVISAIHAGYRHIDTAACYGNEQSVGEAIARSGMDRRSLFVTSKVWNSERGYESTLRAFERSLKNLGLSYLDLYLIHWPASPHQFAEWKQINADTWRAMEKLLRNGLVRAIGVSNFMPLHLEALLERATVTPSVNQIEFHPGYTQPECVAFCRDHGILVEAWSPLGRGRVLNHETLTGLARQYNRTPAQICLRWILQQGILPLPKSVTPSRMKSNLDLAGFALTDEDMQRLETMGYCGASGLHPDSVDF